MFSRFAPELLLLRGGLGRKLFQVADIRVNVCFQKLRLPVPDPKQKFRRFAANVSCSALSGLE
jgi:hypothetical protein